MQRFIDGNYLVTARQRFRPLRDFLYFPALPLHNATTEQPCSARLDQTKHQRITIVALFYGSFFISGMHRAVGRISTCSYRSLDFKLECQQFSAHFPLRLYFISRSLRRKSRGGPPLTRVHATGQPQKAATNWLSRFSGRRNHSSILYVSTHQHCHLRLSNLIAVGACSSHAYRLRLQVGRTFSFRATLATDDPFGVADEMSMPTVTRVKKNSGTGRPAVEVGYFWRFSNGFHREKLRKRPVQSTEHTPHCHPTGTTDTFFFISNFRGRAFSSSGAMLKDRSHIEFDFK